MFLRVFGGACSQPLAMPYSKYIVRPTAHDWSLGFLEAETLWSYSLIVPCTLGTFLLASYEGRSCLTDSFRREREQLFAVGVAVELQGCQAICLSYLLRYSRIGRCVTVHRSGPYVSPTDPLLQPIDPDATPTTWIVPYSLVLQVIAFIMVCLRLGLRAMNKAGALGLDDLLLIPATLGALMQTALIVYSAPVMGLHLWNVPPRQ